MKLNPEKQKKLLMVAMYMILGIFCFWYFGVQGLHSKQMRDSAELASLNDQIAKQTQLIRKEKMDRETAKSYQVYIDSLATQMPKGNTETWLVKELSELAAHYKIQLANTLMQPIDELSDFKFKGLPYKLEGFRFEFKGELNQIGKFLEDLENNIPLMEVDDISITAGSDLAPHIHSVSMRVAMVTKS